MKGERWMCAACWHDNYALSFAIQGTRRCPFCYRRVRPASEVLGPHSERILSLLREALKGTVGGEIARRKWQEAIRLYIEGRGQPPNAPTEGGEAPSSAGRMQEASKAAPTPQEAEP